MLKVSLSLEGKGYLHFSDLSLSSLLHRPVSSCQIVRGQRAIAIGDCCVHPACSRCPADCCPGVGGVARLSAQSGAWSGGDTHTPHKYNNNNIWVQVIYVCIPPSG